MTWVAFVVFAHHSLLEMETEADVYALVYSVILDILNIKLELTTMWSWVEHNSLVAKQKIVFILALGRLDTHADTA